MSKIKAVIFDMDGVIAMTSNIHSQAESDVFAKYGIHITSQEILDRYSGKKDIEMFTDMVKRNNSNLDPQKLRGEKWEIVNKVIAEKDIPVVAGAVNFINNLKTSGFTLAVASSANFSFIKKVLGKMHILNKFQVITSGNEIKAGKPNPEIFLIAARKLKVFPNECVVIEDAPAGLEAAHRAGMRCIAITTTAKREQLKNADKIIDSFSDLSVDDIMSL